MAGSSLLALLDDIATLLDDISVMTKVAAKKTAGVLGDDLAVNAERVTGVRAERELPVVWAVAKGSAVNKLILVPAARGDLTAGALVADLNPFNNIVPVFIVWIDQHAGRNYATGSKTVNVVPSSGSLSTLMRPLRASTNPLTMGSPSPVPVI